jgi:acetoacetate decarboxylase
MTNETTGTAVRYGARAPEQRRNREVEATTAQIWSKALTAVWETDPEVIAAVLPPPLAPIDGEPIVRCTITIVQMPVGPSFGAGWLGVRARHGDVVGEYPLFMPMTTEQSVIGGRETYGEPKKIGEVWSKRDGDAVEGVIARMGFTLVEIRGRVTEPRDPYELDKRDFWFKFMPASNGVGLEADGVLVYGEKHESARVHEGVDGEVILKDSPLDPVADLVVRRVIDINWTERASTQVGHTVCSVPAADLLPYVHQRYDDLSVLGKGAE